MAQGIVRRFLAFCLVGVALSVSAWTQEYKALIGTWSMTSESTGDPVKWTLVLKESDGKLTAFLDTGEKEQPAKNFTYTEGVVKFKAPYQDNEYDVELKAMDNRLDGTWSGGGDSGKTYGTKN